MPILAARGAVRDGELVIDVVAHDALTEAAKTYKHTHATLPYAAWDTPTLVRHSQPTQTLSTDETADSRVGAPLR